MIDISAWLQAFGPPISAGNLRFPAAADLVRFVERHAEDVAVFVEARQGDGKELVVLDLQTGRPQVSACAIKRRERVAVRFADADAMPFVYVLRDDFPDTPHQNLTVEGAPRAICIDNRSWGPRPV